MFPSNTGRGPSYGCQSGESGGRADDAIGNSVRHSHPCYWAAQIKIARTDNATVKIQLSSGKNRQNAELVERCVLVMVEKTTKIDAGGI